MSASFKSLEDNAEIGFSKQEDVNEKIRMTTSMLGLGIQVPAITLPYRETNEEQGGSLDSEIFTKL